MDIPGGAANLRVSDAEREHVVALLQKATGRGLLDLEQFTERTDIALAARTRGELNAVLLDLPGLVHRSQNFGQNIGQDQVSNTGNRLELKESDRRIQRAGTWVVPQTLVLWPRVRSADLDFTTARIDHPEVRIELHGGHTHVRLRLPQGSTLAADGLLTKRGKPSQIRDRGGFLGAGGNPHFTLVGQAGNAMVLLRA